MRPGSRIIIVIIIVVVGIYLARPMIERQLYAETTPRTVEARGDLADYEKTAIAVFERVSPSVVQVVGRANPQDVPGLTGDEAQAQGGTGFVWDRAGHIVTNNHVVRGVGAIAVRFASGEAVRAELVGGAPNYDLAVIRVTGVGRLPTSIAVGSSADGHALTANDTDFDPYIAQWLCDH